MKNDKKVEAAKRTDSFGTFQPKLKRSRAQPRSRIKRSLRQALSTLDKKAIDRLQGKFPFH